MTRLREPYMADRAVYDLVVRYGQAGKPAQRGGSPWELTIEDPHAGRQVHRWSPPDAAEGWISHTLSGVTLSQGATLKLTTTAPAARWDYLELRRREQP